MTAWMRDAACRGHDPDLWFPASGPAGHGMAATAAAICRSCPVQAECHMEWLTLPPMQRRYGIWAGRSEHMQRQRERKRARREQRRRVAS